MRTAVHSSRIIANTVSRPRAVMHVAVDWIATDGYSKLMWFRSKKPNDSIDPLPSDVEVRAQMENLRKICDKKRYGMVSIKLTEALDALHKKI